MRKLLGSLLVAIFVIAAKAALGADAALDSAFPFQIETVSKRIGAGGFPNTTANPFAKTAVTVFRVRYRGAPVRIASGQAIVDEFWDAKILDQAPQPTLIVAGTGVYLLKEQHGRLEVEMLAPATTDLARWQWLDGNNAQPGVEHSVTIRDSAGEPRSEHGGHLLLLNRQRVLDVATLRSYPVAVNSSENVEKMGGYNAGNEQARMLSPGRGQYVLVGERRIGSGSEYALVAVDYANASVYAIPFDRNASRFESVSDATPEWIGHHFEWTRDTRGAERLRLRKDVKVLPWLGRFVRFAGGRVNYTLYPTQPEMYGALRDFLRSNYGATDTASPAGAGADAQAQTVMIASGTAPRKGQPCSSRTSPATLRRRQRMRWWRKSDFTSMRHCARASTSNCSRNIRRTADRSRVHACHRALATVCRVPVRGLMPACPQRPAGDGRPRQQLETRAIPQRLTITLDDQDGHESIVIETRRASARARRRPSAIVIADGNGIMFGGPSLDHFVRAQQE